MPANLSINENGEAEMFSGQGIVPWHKLGTIVEGLLTSREAIDAAKLNWLVESRPAKVDKYNPQGEVVGQIEVPGHNVITRCDNQVPLGIVKERYHIIQNEDAFDFFDGVVSEGKACFDTAGALHGGKLIWIMAKLPGTLFIKDNPSDITEKNVLLVKSHDSSYSLMMQIVPNRVVCSNTLSVALNGATNQIKIRHTKNFKKKMEKAKEALQLCDAYYDNLQALMNHLASVPMDNKEMANFTEKLFPANEESERQPTRTIKIREQVQHLFVHGNGNHGRNRWDALNAVTEYTDNKRATRGAKTQDQIIAQRFESSVLGNALAIKERAVKLLSN